MAPGYAPFTLVSFDGYDGANPQAPLVLGADGSFYGTAQNGGAGGNGVIFRVNINSPAVEITGQPQGQSVFLGANALFSVAVAGNPPLFYQWSRNGANLNDGGNISGSATRLLTISNAGIADVAVYSVTVSNAAGSTAAATRRFSKSTCRRRKSSRRRPIRPPRRPRARYSRWPPWETCRCRSNGRAIK